LENEGKYLRPFSKVEELDWTYPGRRWAIEGCDRGKNGVEKNTRKRRVGMIDELMESTYGLIRKKLEDRVS